MNSKFTKCLCLAALAFGSLSAFEDDSTKNLIALFDEEPTETTEPTEEPTSGLFASESSEEEDAFIVS